MIPLRAAREAGLAGCDYRVLIVIASHANERGFAWPSLKTIASLARTTVPKVSPAIKKLEAAGLLRKQNRVTARGDWNSNVYQVLLQKGVPTAGCGSRVVPSDGTGTAWGGNRTDQGTDQRTETPLPRAREALSMLTDQVQNSLPGRPYIPNSKNTRNSIRSTQRFLRTSRTTTAARAKPVQMWKLLFGAGFVKSCVSGAVGGTGRCGAVRGPG